MKSTWPTHEKVEPAELREFLGSNPDDKTLSFYGISRAQWRRWQSLRTVSLPIGTLRLLRYRQSAHLADLLGPDWHGYTIRGRALTIPGLKRALECNELAALWLWSSQRAWLENKVSLLQSELERRTAELEDAENRTDYYRRMVRLESTMGMMLARLTT